MVRWVLGKVGIRRTLVRNKESAGAVKARWRQQEVGAWTGAWGERDISSDTYVLFFALPHSHRNMYAQTQNNAMNIVNEF